MMFELRTTRTEVAFTTQTRTPHVVGMLRLKTTVAGVRALHCRMVGRMIIVPSYLRFYSNAHRL